MHKQALALLGLLLLPACSLQERLAELAAPEVSCAASEIEISDTFSTHGTSRYKATCNDGQAYRCISMGKPFGDEPETTCQPLNADSEDAPGAAHAIATGGPAPRGALPGGWPRLRLEACGAEVTMPPGAKISHETEPTQQLPMHKADAAAGESSFGFLCMKLPGEPGTRRPAEEVIAGGVRGALEAVDGELVQSRKLPGVVGRSLLVRVDGATMAMRIWIEGNWMYSATVVPIDKLPEGVVAEYLANIQVASAAP